MNYSLLKAHRGILDVTKTLLGLVLIYLFAVACKKSFELGFEGYMALHAKSKLVEHYQEVYGAILIDPSTSRMIIDPYGARKLVNQYFD
ncbi:hypothetical protein [Aquibacillus salsiterrae]|uniref:Uncharacterized protein n=1 Tax=Aquibacillus salsiterrae TaxID=2950439 RepID=A0A9X3WBN0_9BACI|nr:hypothetical protein [Aquibacillus salsiterrae]MDC3416690.1 hypothetical protein [Aquibacillus salsiterrae]